MGGGPGAGERGTEEWWLQAPPWDPDRVHPSKRFIRLTTFFKMQIGTCGYSHLAVNHQTEQQIASLPISGLQARWQGWEGRVTILGRRPKGTQGRSLAIFQMRKSVHFRTKARADATYLEGRTF